MFTMYTFFDILIGFFNQKCALYIHERCLSLQKTINSSVSLKLNENDLLCSKFLGFIFY